MQPDRIELGLQRITQVADACDLLNPDFRIITVAGTNGKGSTVAYTATILRGNNYSVGVYTSPHFVDFNERIVVDGARADENMLCEAFSFIESKRKGIQLTYFEFTTLAAIRIFKQERVDIAVLEVGLGGRLDAVNAWDSDVGCVTSIGLDHKEWLGDDRETIGREKAGIARSQVPLVCGDTNLPGSVVDVARNAGARVLRLGIDFKYRQQTDGWHYQGPHGSLDLPPARIAGEWAKTNASVAITACAELLGRLPTPQVVVSAVESVRVPGRMQLATYRDIPVLLDVAHNPQAASVLAGYLHRHPKPTIAVFSCLQDKDASGIIEALSHDIDHWHIVQLDYPRAIDGHVLANAISESSSAGLEVFASVIQALDAAVAQSVRGGRIVVFGSFYVVGPVLQVLDNQGDHGFTGTDAKV